MKRTMKVLFVIAIVAVFGGRASARDRDVILTTDCGAEIDDQFAASYLLLVPQVHIKAIVTTHAPNLPQKAESSAECVKEIIRRLGVDSPPPVFAGSNVALTGRTPLRNAGVNFIVDAANHYSAANRLVIITIGATTDVASAFLSDPKLGDRVEILTMGFDSWPKGGDPWNIKNDPLAYQVVLESSAPITIGASSVCQEHLRIDDKRAAQMLQGHGEFAEWLNAQFQHWITANADLAASVVKPHTWVIWDTVTVAHLLGFTTTVTHPRPALNLADQTFSFPKTDKTLRWITSIDENKMWPDFVHRLDQANARRPARAASN
jgi:inosine-uridine nucleoside N-ribohydrolase